jgi:hypothetical protein
MSSCCNAFRRAERWRDVIAAALQEATGVHCVFERSDAEVRSLEGLPARTGTLNGVLPEVVTIIEDGITYRIDVVQGQKTGFYLTSATTGESSVRTRRQARAQCLLLHRRILAGRARGRRGVRAFHRQFRRRAGPRA